MKKNILTIMVLISLMISCASAPAPAPAEPPQEEAKSEAKTNGLTLPSFVLNPPQYEDMLVGVGYAKMATFNNTKTFAEARARQDIANQINVSVKGAIVDYSQEAGNGDNPQVIQFAETISKQITDTTLSGAAIVRREQDSEGGLWVLCQYPKANMLKSFEDTTKSFTRDEEAAFSEFKADQALKFLEKELDENPTSSSPVKE